LRGHAGRWLVALALIGAAVAGCGKKGPPVSPERRLPMPASALRAHIEDGAIVVGWTNPRTRVDGSALRDLTRVTLYRRGDPDGAPLKPAMLVADRVAGYDQIAAIRLDSPAPAIVQRDVVEWTDRRGLVLGHRYVYVVTATDSIGRTSPPAERLAVPFLAPPRSPRSVEAVPGDRQVTLTWQPPAEFTDGTPLAGQVAYVVLRGAGDEGPLGPVGEGGVATTAYTDSGLDNDTAYRYAIRAVRVDPRVAAVGPPSGAVTATPRDTTPPRPPSDLAAVPSPGALRLAWRPSPDPDVALYAIYRAAASGEFIRVGTTLAGVTTFIDRDVRPGVAYRYVVTALDRARTPNESGRSNEATASAR
jgi:hypothetical protein